MKRLIEELEALINQYINDDVVKNNMLNKLLSILSKYSTLEDSRDITQHNLDEEIEKNKELTDKLVKYRKILDVLLNEEYD